MDSGRCSSSTVIVHRYPAQQLGRMLREEQRLRRCCLRAVRCFIGHGGQLLSMDVALTLLFILFFQLLLSYQQSFGSVGGCCRSERVELWSRLFFNGWRMSVLVELQLMVQLDFRVFQILDRLHLICVRYHILHLDLFAFVTLVMHSQNFHTAFKIPGLKHATASGQRIEMEAEKFLFGAKMLVKLILDRVKHIRMRTLVWSLRLRQSEIGDEHKVGPILFDVVLRMDASE